VLALFLQVVLVLVLVPISMMLSTATISIIFGVVGVRVPGTGHAVC
jgi:hypothetical protein